MTRKSPSELIRQAIADLGHLLRLQLALARELFADAARPVGRSARLGVVGFLLVTIGLLCALGAAVAGIAVALPVWLSLLIVAGVSLAVGLLLARVAARGFKVAASRLASAAAQLKEESKWTPDESL